MAYLSRWRLFTNTKSERAALKVSDRLKLTFTQELTDYSLEAYHKGGHVISFRLLHEKNLYTEVLLEVLQLSQEVARKWQLLGDYSGQPSWWSNDARISGLTAASWDLFLEDDAK